MTIATFNGSLTAGIDPDTMNTIKSNPFTGFAIVFRANLGRSHTVYLREVSLDRAMAYAESEAAAIGAHRAEVWQVASSPRHSRWDWSEERLIGT